MMDMHLLHVWFSGTLGMVRELPAGRDPVFLDGRDFQLLAPCLAR